MLEATSQPQGQESLDDERKKSRIQYASGRCASDTASDNNQHGQVVSGVANIGIRFKDTRTVNQHNPEGP